MWVVLPDGREAVDMGCYMVLSIHPGLSPARGMLRTWQRHRVGWICVIDGPFEADFDVAVDFDLWRYGFRNIVGYVASHGAGNGAIV